MDKLDYYEIQLIKGAVEDKIELLETHIKEMHEDNLDTPYSDRMLDQYYDILKKLKEL